MQRMQGVFGQVNTIRAATSLKNKKSKNNTIKISETAETATMKALKTLKISTSPSYKNLISLIPTMNTAFPIIPTP